MNPKKVHIDSLYEFIWAFEEKIYHWKPFSLFDGDDRCATDKIVYEFHSYRIAVLWLWSILLIRGCPLQHK